MLVVSGPSGVGKGTVVRALRARSPDLTVSVSTTTRPPRPDEREGLDYHFVDAATFDEMIAEGAFLEWAEFAGHRYGTRWDGVRTALTEGRTTVLEIDVQGALQVKDRYPSATLVFLTPPDRGELLSRLSSRGTDSPATIAERTRIAGWELEQCEHFDHVVVNEEVNTAADEIASILGTSAA